MREAKTMTTREFFRILEDQRFSSFHELQESVLREFNSNLDHFPRHYSYLQLIDWALANRWIVADDGDGFRVRVADEGSSGDASRDSTPEEIRELEAALA